MMFENKEKIWRRGYPPWEIYLVLSTNDVAEVTVVDVDYSESFALNMWISPVTIVSVMMLFS